MYWETLGYNEAIWNGTDVTTKPASSTSAWSELSTAEKEAATNLCYMQETWDGLPLTDWVSSAPPTVSPAPTVTFYENVDIRYTIYNQLGCAEKDAATTLEYNEALWNNPGSHDIEALSWFSNLPENGGMIQDFEAAATVLVLNEDTWGEFVCWYHLHV